MQDLKHHLNLSYWSLDMWGVSRCGDKSSEGLGLKPHGSLPQKHSLTECIYMRGLAPPPGRDSGQEGGC